MKYNFKLAGCTILASAFLMVHNIALSEDFETVQSDGGIVAGSENNEHWFKIGGVLKLDQRLYMANKGKRSEAGNEVGTYHSGAQVRSLGLDFEGGIGKDWSYNVGLSFDSKESKVSVEDAYLTYKGFKNIGQYGDNLSVSVGQVNPGFCLENTSSSKWTPFLERSLASSAFAPCTGLGVNVNKWDDNYSITAVASQPKTNATAKDTKGSTVRNSDRWTTSARVTFAPILEEGRLVQVGVSGHLQNDHNHGIAFSTNPEAASRHTTTLLNTTIVNGDDSTYIASKKRSTLDLELTAQNGPLSGEIEYQVARVKRGTGPTGVSQGENLLFNGYHIQASYVLTGEVRPHKKSSGTLGQIKPESKNGAWEVSARYSFINLNNKDIKGGTAYNTTCSLSWYANNNIRVIGEFLNSRQRREFSVPTAYLDKRNLNSIGLRLQAVF